MGFGLEIGQTSQYFSKETLTCYVILCVFIRSSDLSIVSHRSNYQSIVENTEDAVIYIQPSKPSSGTRKYLLATQTFQQQP